MASGGPDWLSVGDDASEPRREERRFACVVETDDDAFERVAEDGRDTRWRLK
jgi:hypothetical protein